MKKIAFLHAHHSNIELIEDLFSLDALECIHFVDPALIERLTTDASFTKEDAQQKVID